MAGRRAVTKEAFNAAVELLTSADEQSRKQRLIATAVVLTATSEGNIRPELFQASVAAALGEICDALAELPYFQEKH